MVHRTSTGGQVIATAGTTAQSLAGQIDVIGKAIQSAAESCCSPIIFAALAGYANQRAADFRFALQRPAAMINALAACTAAYVSADQQMIGNVTGAGSGLSLSIPMKAI